LCLKEATQLQPDRASSYQALAVSYTNEFRYTEAYEALEAAIKTNPRYAGVQADPGSIRQDETSSPAWNARFHEIQDLYFAAAQMSPEELDPDVQIGLGVLYNIKREYDKAVDCFQSALQSRPDDSYLWNKLGATLANGDRSGEAVSAYARALEIRPGYIRARYNLGISCMNLKSYKDAAEHFLGALSMQQLATEGSTQRNMSDTIWHSLRSTLFMAKQPELVSLVTDKKLEPFKAHFDF